MTAAVRAIAVAAVVFFCLLLEVSVGVARKEIDYDALERAWEDGDAAPELLSEGDEQFRHLSEGTNADAKALGPQMIFVTLDKDVGEPLGDLASRWKEDEQMLWLGGVDVSIYELSASKLLVGLQKGMFVSDLRRFLSRQSHVKEYEWNGETFRVSTGSMTRKKRHKPAKNRKAASAAKQNSVHTQTEL